MASNLFRIRTASASLAVVTLLLAACGGDAATTTPAGAATSGDYDLRVSGYYVPMQPEDLVQRAAAGIDGEVIAIAPARWSTVSGRAPDGWVPGTHLPQPEVIFQTITIRVGEAYYSVVGNEIRVAMLGGSADGVRMTVEGPSVPDIAIGDHVVVFVERAGPGWRLSGAEFGLVQAFRIDGNRATSEGLAPLDAGDLAARVRAAAQRKLAQAQ